MSQVVISQLELDGQTIRYASLNNHSSKNLLILHGWGSNLENWLDFLEQFKNADLNIFLPDLLGFGQSSLPPRPFGVKDYTEFVKKLADHFGLQIFYLFGHSFGGQVALNFTHYYPNRVIKLFLSAPAIVRPRSSAIKKKLAGLAKILKNFLPQPLKRLFYYLIGSPDYGVLTSEVMKQTFQKMIATDLTHLLPAVKTPTVIFWGKKDRYTPLEHSQLIAGLLPNAQVYVFADARHGLYLQKAVELKEIILKNL